MTVAVVDYGAGNRSSVENALRHLGVRYTVAPEPAPLRDADRVIFPGVGEARSAMRELRRRGLDSALRHVFHSGRPLLGICIGAQVVLTRSEEGDVGCLGLMPGSVVRFVPPREHGSGLKVPHMGWNRVHLQTEHPLFHGIPPATSFYFVHSYYPTPGTSATVLGVTDYGVRFASAYALDNLAAVQFHAEKSGEHGLQVLANFLEWDGA